MNKFATLDCAKSQLNDLNKNIFSPLSESMANWVESQPLLLSDSESTGGREFREPLALNTLVHCNLPSRSAWRKHLRFYVLIFSLQFVTNLGFYLSALPLVRLFEREICQHYYGSTDDIAEAMCKLPAIQDKLAYILELKDAFDALPGQKSVVHSLQPSNLLDQAFFYLYGTDL